MSQILAADKRSHGQALHARAPRDSAAGPCTKGRPAGSPAPSGAPLNSPRQARMADIKKSLQKNVFIDSYYPRVQGDSSETTRSRSSFETERGQAFPPDGANTKDSSIVGSRGTYEETTDESSGNSSCIPREVNLAQCSSGTDHSTTSPTLDTKTYILLSSSSEVESTCLHTCRPLGNKFFLNSRPVEERQLEGGDNAAECFTQLYHRIHNLEDLLQQTIVKTLPAESHKGPEATVKAPSKSKVVKSKTGKIKGKMCLAAGMAKAWESTCQSIPEGSGERENSDTDSELKRIKKRLKMIEKKLSKVKKMPPPALFQQRSYQEPLACNSLEFADSCDRKCTVTSSVRETDTTAPVCSETESIHPSEVAVLNSEGDFHKKKVKSKVKKKIISKCRNIKRKCSSIVSFSRNAPLKVSTNSGWKKVLYKHSVVTKESVATTLLNQSFSANTRTDSSTVFFLKCQQKGQFEPLSEPKKKKGKKRKYLSKKNSKTNILSTKIPVGELFLRPPPKPDAFVFGDYDRSRSAALQLCDSKNKLPSAPFDDHLWSGSPWKGIAVELPPWEDLWIPPQEKIYARPPDQQQKTSKKRLSFRNPLDILKRGGKIKIPVLFEEICKTSDKKEPERKLSNISMRFVVVQENDEHPLTPLRRLVKKLSQTKPLPKADQFIFGVSKCRCNSQVHRLSSISERNVTSGFS